jgi:predicted RND superfamily exporter protein
LGPLLLVSARRPFLVLLGAGVLAVLAGWKASELRINTDLAALLPEAYPSVQALNRLKEAVGGESAVEVAIESRDVDAARAFAERLIPEALTLRRLETGTPYLTGVEYRRDLRFLDRHLLYFATPDELDTLEAFVRAQMDRARVLADALALDSGDAIEPSPRSVDLRAAFAALGLREYPISSDSTVLALRFHPTGAQTDIGFIDDLYSDLDSLIASLDPAAFAPDMRVTTAGRLLRQSVEIHAITDDVRRSFGAGVATVLLVVVLFFLYKTVHTRSRGGFRWRIVAGEVVRTPVMALVLGLPLLIGLCWSGAVAAMAIGELNLMTSTLGLVLFGLGIDYGIHFYARYVETRGGGRSVEQAAEETFTSAAPAVVASALSTAASLFVLVLADFRGFSEFGLIGGCGILFSAVTMLTVLPALLVLAERFHLLHLDSGLGEAEAEARAPRRVPFTRSILAGGLLLCIVALVLLPRVRFEYDFGKLEPTYPAYEARAARAQPVYDAGRLRNPAYLLLDEPEDVAPTVDALRRLAREDTLILAVESLQERFPTDTASARWKLDRLAEIRVLLDDPFLQLDTTGAVERLREALSITEPIPLDSVPDFLKQPFMTKSGEVGNFILVYPSATLSEGRRSIHFANLVGEVRLPDGRTVHAASTSLVAADMLRLMLSEAPKMVLIAALLIVVLMALTFRSARWTALALVPLVVGLLWMLGVLAVAGIPLTFYNLVVLPAILGIGNDSGVHIVHRYREEGPGSIRRILRSTGEHVAMGALTTLIGFAGQLLSFHPGLRSIGLLAVAGNTATMLAALVLLPALIQVLEDRGWLPEPRGDFAVAEEAAA